MLLAHSALIMTVLLCLHCNTRQQVVSKSEDETKEGIWHSCQKWTLHMLREYNMCIPPMHDSACRSFWYTENHVRSSMKLLARDWTLEDHACACMRASMRVHVQMRACLYGRARGPFHVCRCKYAASACAYACMGGCM